MICHLCAVLLRAPKICYYPEGWCLFVRQSICQKSTQPSFSYFLVFYTVVNIVGKVIIHHTKKKIVQDTGILLLPSVCPSVCPPVQTWYLKTCSPKKLPIMRPSYRSYKMGTCKYYEILSPIQNVSLLVRQPRYQTAHCYPNSVVNPHSIIYF